MIARLYPLLIFMVVIMAAPMAYACSNPTGVAGDTMFNETHNVPQYCDGTNWIAMKPKPYIPNPVVFDDDADRLFLISPGLNYPTTKQMTVSFWFKLDSVGNTVTFFSNDGSGVNFNAAASQKNVWFNLLNAADSGIMRLRTFVGSVLHANKWYHYMASIDLTDTAKRHVYLNGVEASAGLQSHDNDFIKGSGGSNSAVASGQYRGEMADLWVDYGTYIDLSIEENRRKFIDATGNPVYLGDNGQLPIGAVPDMFLTGDTANWHTNKGTGGGYPLSSTTLTTGTSFPSVPRTAIVPNGLVGHWRLDETSGTTAFDSSGNGNDGTMQNGLDATNDSVDGQTNLALDFDGTDDTITGLPYSVGELGDLNSFAFWARFDTVPDNKIGFGQSGAVNIVVGVKDNQAITYANASSSEVNGGTVPMGEWVHLAMVRDGATVRHYINGVGAGSGTLSNSADIRIDRFGNRGSSGEYFDGQVDDIRIYNRALTAAEVAEIYNARDGIRYNATEKVPEYFDGNKFIPMRPAFAEVGDGYSIDCPTIGTICSDGSIYGGTSPTNGYHVYTMDIDQSLANYQWKTSTGIDDVLLDSNTNGLENHANRLGNLSDFPAFERCENLNAHGKTDWYLPSREELTLIYVTHKAAINANAVFPFTTQEHWASTEESITRARIINDGAFQGASDKDNPRRVRCVRQQNSQSRILGGLIGHWKLDETSGTTAVDSSGNGNNLQINSGNDFSQNSTNGAIGRAFQLDQGAGFNTGSRMIASNVLPTGAVQPFSVSAWIRDDGPENTQFWIVNEDGVNGSFALQKNGIAIRSSTPGGEHRQTITQPIQQWFHTIVTYDGRNTRLYVNKNYISGGFPDFNNPVIMDSGDFKIGRIGNFRTNISAIDDVRAYDRVLSTEEIDILYQMGTQLGASTALPQGCPNIGDVCDDGTIYAGDTDGGTVKMFAMPRNEGQLSWDNGVTGNDTSVTTSNNDGETNTSNLVTSDADSTGGFEPHIAAQTCYDLNAQGADDWYLPSIIEANLFINPTASGAFSDIIEPNGGFPVGFYWTSAQQSAAAAHHVHQNSTGTGFTTKQFSLLVHCVRKGPAPRCANPYGIEGAMLYNTTHDVMQYCDGARWIGIGKSS